MYAVESAPDESLREHLAIRSLFLLNGSACFVVAAGLYVRAEWATRSRCPRDVRRVAVRRTWAIV